MKLHIYHCNLAILTDRKPSPTGGGKAVSNKPAGIIRYPSEPGRADVHFLPVTDSFRMPWPRDTERPIWLDDNMLSKLLEQFKSVDIFDPEGSPVLVNWRKLEERLGLDREQLNMLLAKADQMGLLRRLTIEYDHAKWMRWSRNKGCLVIMTCVEKSDYQDGNIVERFCDEVTTIRDKIVSGSQELTEVIIVPNVHLTTREDIGDDWEKTITLLQNAKRKLEERDFHVQLNSFGYAKNILLAINAHKLGYVFRSIGK